MLEYLLRLISINVRSDQGQDQFQHHHHHINFTVLVRTHCPWVNITGDQFLNRNLKTTILSKRSRLAATIPLPIEDTHHHGHVNPYNIIQNNCR